MGSKSPDGQHQGQNGSSTEQPISPGNGKPQGSHHAEDGDGEFGNGDDDDDDEDAVEEDVDASVIKGSADDDSNKKKKKRKRTKKKKSKSAPVGEGVGAAGQTSPPRVPVSTLFKGKAYPEGEILLYDIKDGNLSRTTAEEKRYNSRLIYQDEEWYANYRKAAEVHRQARQWAQRTIQPGQGLTEIAVGIEDAVRSLLDNQGLEPGSGLVSGLGFPTGLALNNCAAHFTPNPRQPDVILQQSDVMKIDFGVHINGWIVDSAFTMAFDPIHDNLLAAVKDATNTGIRHSGIDARVSEIGAAIQEAMESYEVEVNGKMKHVKAIRTITGHNIDQYRIHAGKSVPFVKNNSKDRMEEGEVFAIETFGTTGSGYLRDGTGVYGYGKNFDYSPSALGRTQPTTRSLLKTIEQNFGTIVFSRRSLERLSSRPYLLAMKELISAGIVENYPPLMDTKGSYTAQFEHTILLRSNCTEVLSRGDDY